MNLTKVLPNHITSSLPIVLLVLSACSISFASRSFEISFSRHEYLNITTQKEVSQPCLISKSLLTQNEQKQIAFHTPKANPYKNLHEFYDYSFEASEITSYQSSQSAYEVNKLKTQPQFFTEIMVSEVDQVSSKFASSHDQPIILPNIAVRNVVRVEFEKVPTHKFSNNSESEEKPVTVIVKKAVYGLLDKPDKQVDVTAKVQAQVSLGDYDITPTNRLVDKDPASGIKKALKISYTVNDELVTLIIPEKFTINL